MEIPAYDTATRFVSTDLLLYYSILLYVTRRAWVDWCVVLLFSGPMVLSPLDDGALRTNYLCCSAHKKKKDPESALKAITGTTSTSRFFL